MISVITPCYNLIKENRVAWFEKMMRSVHEQSYPDIEHIAIDDGSDDETMELLRRYQKNGWLNRIIQKNHVGIYHTMNQGLKTARGEYINIMNTDDYILDNNFFKESIVSLEKSGADFSHGDRIIKSPSGFPDAKKKGNEKTAFFRMPFRHQTMIVRKNIFDEIGLFDEKYKIASDYKWILKMLLSGKRGIYIPKTFICSLAGGASSNRQGCIDEVSQIIYEAYGEKYGLSPEECRQIYLRKIRLPLLLKILAAVQNNKIKRSLLYCYYLSFRRR